MFKKAKENKKGFTLAELLIVVAIIAVLVAISIPIFTSQLEKSRDAVSVANLRSAYAEAQSTILTGSSSGGNVKYDSNKHTVTVENVMIKSQTADNWSNQASELPFYNKMSSTGTAEDTTNHGDAAQNKAVNVVFTYNATEDTLTSVTIPN